MKKILLLVILSVLLILSTSVALAGDIDEPTKKDDHAKVQFFDDACQIWAGDWGMLYNTDAWIATYSNDVTILKCIGHVDNPPEETVTYTGLECAIPGDYTDNGTVKVYPDGKVRAICKFAP